MSTPVFKEEILMEWVEACISEKALPISVEISIDKKGKHKIEMIVSGNKLRSRFVTWLADEFRRQTDIVPPKRMTGQAWNRTWLTPMESLLRQSVYKAGIRYDELQAREKYVTVHALTFRLLLKDVVAFHRDNSLVIAQPLSILKTGTALAAEGDYYRRAVRQNNR